jgi:ABC-type Fe3+/spermidine/putrescine transport system ATPase subunit
MADRIGIMQNGRMVQIGTPAQLYETPANRFVASFLGAANILPCVVGSDGVSVGLPGPGVSIRAERPGRPGPGLLALRSERLRIGAASRVNQIEGVVTGCIYAGDALAVTVRLADGSVLRVKRSLSDGLESARLEPGSPVRVGWQPDACILLPE